MIPRMDDEQTIVVAGEALVDLVLGPDEELRGHPGGGPFNTARTLGRLQQPVRYLGCVSDDRLGTRLRAELAADGVRLDATVPTANPTTLALAEIDGAGSATYRFYTEGTSAPALTTEGALAALPDAVGMLHVGTLGLVLEPMATALQAVVEAVGDTALVMVDPNCRPALIPDPDAYRNRLATTLHRTHVVKASEDDLGWLYPGVPPVTAARRLLEQGPRVAVITRGADGALVVTPQAEIPVSAPPTDVIDTIGAGDAFSGGFLAWWRLRGLTRRQLDDPESVVAATRFGCLVAARTCARAGATPPRLSELEGSLPA
jgi:fructokinase